MNKLARVVSKGRSDKRVWLLLGLFLWVLSGKLSSFHKSKTPYVMPTVMVEAVKSTEHSATVEAVGMISGDRKIDLLSQSDGEIIELSASAGLVAKAGDILARLNDRGAASALESAKQSLEEKQSLYDTEKELSRMGYHAKVSLYSRRSELAAAQAAYKKAQDNYERTVVLAPYDALIGDVPVDLHQIVGPSTVMMSIFSADSFKVEVSLSTHDARKVLPGYGATVLLPNGRAVHGIVDTVDVVADPVNKMYKAKIIVAVENIADYPLKMVGTPCRVMIEAGKRVGFEVPGSALTISDDGIMGIKYVGEDGKVIFMPVKIEELLPSGFIVSGPVGDSINLIVRGAAYVNHDQIVRAVSKDEYGTGIQSTH